jgi:predicted metalloprotease with PDZ domain
MRFGWLLGAAVLLAGAKAPERTIDYSVGVADAHHLEVEIRLTGDADGETLVGLPAKWAGADDLWKAVSDFSVSRGTASGDGQVRTIRHAPDAPLVIRYRVASGGKDDAPSAEKAWPTVRGDYFFFHGESVFARVDGREGAPVRFRWGRIPAGWTEASDLDRIPAAGGRFDDLAESASLAGRDLHIATRMVAGAPLRVAVQGDWGFGADDLLDRVARIVAAEHAFWREPAQPFLVTLVPAPDLGPGVTSYTGTGRGDAFSIVSTPNLELVQATRLLAHEYMHHWVPGLLGGLPERDEGRDYWFSEGFDDYLTTRTLLRAGLWTPAEWVADKNEVLLRYGSSPARNADAAEVARKFWQDQDFEKVSYDRGHLLALVLDRRIRAATRGRLGLDRVLLVQRKAARRGGPTGATLFAATVKKLADLDVRPLLQRFAVRGELVRLPDDLAPGCLRVLSSSRRSFTRGFDIDATEAADRSIRGVDPAGPAFAAGMREGMKLVKREAGTIGDSTQDIAYRVVDGGQERVLRYRPEGKEILTIQQLVPAFGTDPERCRRALAGSG